MATLYKIGVIFLPMQFATPPHDSVLVRVAGFFIITMRGTCTRGRNSTYGLEMATRDVAIQFLVTLFARRISHVFWFVAESQVIPWTLGIGLILVHELASIVLP
jgi:hypothetical protein